MLIFTTHEEYHSVHIILIIFSRYESHQLTGAQGTIVNVRKNDDK